MCSWEPPSPRGPCCQPLPLPLSWGSPQPARFRLRPGGGPSLSALAAEVRPLPDQAPRGHSRNELRKEVIPISRQGSSWGGAWGPGCPGLGLRVPFSLSLKPQREERSPSFMPSEVMFSTLGAGQKSVLQAEAQEMGLWRPVGAREEGGVGCPDTEAAPASPAQARPAKGTWPWQPLAMAGVNTGFQRGPCSPGEPWWGGAGAGVCEEMSLLLPPARPQASFLEAPGE